MNFYRELNFYGLKFVFKDFFRNTLDNVKVPKKLKKAFENGYNYNKNLDEDFKNCYKDYPFCPYSAKTMIKIITFNKAVFG